MKYQCLLSNGDTVVNISTCGSEVLHPVSDSSCEVISLGQDRQRFNILQPGYAWLLQGNPGPPLGYRPCVPIYLRHPSVTYAYKKHHKLNDPSCFFILNVNAKVSLDSPPTITKDLKNS